MDNRSPRQPPGTIALAETAGAQLRFLPAHAPDLHPIAQMWSKAKKFLRIAKARTEAALWASGAATLAAGTAADAAGWFAPCGHGIMVMR